MQKPSGDRSNEMTHTIPTMYCRDCPKRHGQVFKHVEFAMTDETNVAEMPLAWLDWYASICRIDISVPFPPVKIQTMHGPANNTHNGQHTCDDVYMRLASERSVSSVSQLSFSLAAVCMLQFDTVRLSTALNLTAPLSLKPDHRTQRHRHHMIVMKARSTLLYCEPRRDRHVAA